MYTALYYPHSAVRNQAVVKTALLLWDRLEYIIPFPGYPADSGSRSIDEAVELIGSPRIPTAEEKRKAHEQITALAEMKLPKWFAFEPHNPELRYLVYPQKFLPETWETLQHSRLALPYQIGDFQDYVLGKWFGLAMMSILAETCAGQDRRLITDETDSYVALARHLAISTAPPFSKTRARGPREWVRSLPVKTYDPRRIAFRRLLQMRKEEATGKDTFLRELRHNYMKAVDAYVASVSSSELSPADREERQRVFVQEITGDAIRLQRALKAEATRALLSKEVLVATLGAFGMAVEPASGLLSIGALARTRLEYRSKRRDALTKHASAWLYVAAHQFQMY